MAPRDSYLRSFLTASILALAAMAAVFQPALAKTDSPGQAGKQSAPGAGQGTQRYVKDGVTIEFGIRPLQRAADAPLMEGETVEVRFKLSDEATGQPLRGFSPGAWMDIGYVLQGQPGAEQKSCKDKIALYLQGVVGIRPMLDLNSYYVLVLNRDSSISVIDPLVSMVGVTSTLARTPLPRPGADWIASADSKRVFISMPNADQVAVMDADTFGISTFIDAGKAPTRLALQPDGRYLWVGNDARDTEASGVTVIDTDTLEVVGQVATGAGHHEIAFSDDSRFAFVTNRNDGTVTRVDVRTLRVAGTTDTGGIPISVGYSGLSGSVYVAEAEGGELIVLGGSGFAETARVTMKPGLGPLRFTPDGRYAMVVNPSEDKVYVVDVSSNSVVHQINVAGQPYQLTFTRAFGYVRSLASERVTMINLATLGAGRNPIVQSFAAGSVPPKAAGDIPLADSIVKARDDAAVLVVNPADNTTYFYMEGMNAPMSNYKSFGASARAVMVLDRSLQEIEAGVYTTHVRIPAAGRYDVAFTMDSPSLLHCFSASVEENPNLVRVASYKTRFLLDSRKVDVGGRVAVRFSITDDRAGTPQAGLTDVRVLSYLVPGKQRLEQLAREVEPGIYQAQVPIESYGAYSVRVAVPSLDQDYHDLSFITLIAEDPAHRAEIARRLEEQQRRAKENAR